MIQNQVSTFLSPIDITSSNSYISTAMQQAITGSGMSSIECSNFGVSKSVSSTKSTDGTVSYSVSLAVTFYCDNSIPFTPLDLYTGNLQGTFLPSID